MAKADLGPAGAPRNPRIVAWGELLWDLFPDRAFLGGSAANVAYHAALLGAESWLVSAVGDDALGHKAISCLKQAGVNTDAISTERTASTGQVRVTLVEGEPHFRIEEDVAWDRIAPSEDVIQAILGADVFCFSTLAQRTPVMRSRLRSVLSRIHDLGRASCFGGAPGRRPLCLLDLNLRPPFTETITVIEALRFADIVKLNEAEATWVEGRCAGMSAVNWLLREFNLRAVVVTRGAAGADLYTRCLQVHGAAPLAHGGDPVGAGDAFVAALSVAIGRGDPLPSALERANRHGAWVAGQCGAMPRRN